MKEGGETGLWRLTLLSLTLVDDLLDVTPVDDGERRLMNAQVGALRRLRDLLDVSLRIRMLIPEKGRFMVRGKGIERSVGTGGLKKRGREWITGRWKIEAFF